MLRYFKRNLGLAVLALGISILARLSTPAVAMMEQQMIDRIIQGDLTGFYHQLFWAGGIVIAAALLYFLNARTQKRFQVRFEEDIRNDLYDGIMRQDESHFRERDTSEQMSFIKSHASTISNNLTKPVFVLISYGVMAIVVFGIMIYYNPWFALLAMICAIPSIAAPLYFNKKLSNQLMTKLEKDAIMTFHLKETLNAHETIAAFDVFLPFRRRFANANQNLAAADYKMEVTVSLLENVAQILQKVIWFLSFFVAGSMAVRGSITVGVLVMFITLFAEWNACMTLYAQVIPLLLSIRPDVKKMLAVIDNEGTEFTGRISPTYERLMEVKDLSFQYTKGVPVLGHLNLIIKRGEKIAIIGASGGGKSTLIRLLSGYYANYTGSICYDGMELHELDVHKLRELVTVIHQNTFLFHDTIRFNICLGEEFSEKSVKEALHVSGVDRFLDTVPGGLEGQCGENGSQLSGGQRQRIALARAMIRGVQFLILDEGVSAIDVATANEIEQELLDMQDLTLLTITHRIKDGLTSQYDRVLLLENGRLAEKA